MVYTALSANRLANLNVLAKTERGEGSEPFTTWHIHVVCDGHELGGGETGNWMLERLTSRLASNV